MSYCRWSSANWKCDLYCYSDIYGGYTTHVASNRHHPPPFDSSPYMWAAVEAHKHKDKDPLSSIMANQAWAWARKQEQKDLDQAELVPIGLPHDGESFNDHDLTSFLERVRHLKEVGYNVPDFVEATILAEMEEENES